MTKVDFVFALCFLVAGDGAEGARVLDMLVGGSTCPLSILRFFLGGRFSFVDPGVSDGWVGVLSEVAFNLFAFAFSLASCRRAFRRA